MKGINESICASYRFAQLQEYILTLETSQITRIALCDLVDSAFYSHFKNGKLEMTRSSLTKDI